MRSGKASRTAQWVALTRAVLHRNGVLDDPYAKPMLNAVSRVVFAACVSPPLRRRTNSPFFAALATRVVFFDREVTAALDAGIDQIVIVGAGYDARAWRFARTGARFFEVDHPATQDDKRRRAPAGGPTYVTVDLVRDSLRDCLHAAGFDASRSALYVVEGLTMYLERDGVRTLLATLADGAASGTRLAVNFAAPPDAGAAEDRRLHRALRIGGRAVGEPHLSFVGPAEADALVASAGWNVNQVATLHAIAPGFFKQTRLRLDGINPEAAVVAASVTT